mgnify:CR=1 FL=1
MRIRLLTFVAFLGLLLPGAFAHAAPTAADDKAMQAVLTELVDAVNANDVEAAVALISPNSPELQSEVRAALAAGSLTYSLNCAQWDILRREIGDGSVAVSCKYDVRGASVADDGMHWSTSGMITNFVFMQNDAGDWLIVDSEFARDLMPSAALAYVGKFVVALFGICLLILAFWLWMFIDCLRRDFKDKTLWVILLIFVGPLAALLYFFIVKRAGKAVKVK